MTEALDVCDGIAGNIFVRSVRFPLAGMATPEDASSFPFAIHVAYGSVEITTKEKRIELHAPHLVWVPANTMHSIRALTDGAVCGITQAIRDETGAVADLATLEGFVE